MKSETPTPANLDFRAFMSWSSRQSRWLLLLLLPALTLNAVTLGCAQREPGDEQLTPEEERAVADTVAALTDEVRAAFEDLEPERYREFFSDDFVAYVRGSRVSRSEWQKDIRKFMNGLRDISHEPTSRDLEVLGPDAAVVSQQKVGGGVIADGDSFHSTVAETFVWEHRDGEWKIVQHHESFVPAEDGS